MWQRYAERRGEQVLVVGVAEDAQGAERVAPVVAARGVRFPVLLDAAGELARPFGLQMVPAGVFVEDGIVRLVQRAHFDIGDPRVRANLEAFAAGAPLELVDDEVRMNPRALDVFAEGVHARAAGDRAGALALWRQALDLDPANHLIRSQIWVEEHPERFGAEIDVAWQELQLVREGY